MYLNALPSSIEFGKTISNDQIDALFDKWRMKELGNFFVRLWQHGWRFLNERNLIHRNGKGKAT
jgi:hypothetical protein